MTDCDDGLVVFVIDDDASVRDSLALLLGVKGYTTRIFEDGDTFLEAHTSQAGPWSGCVLTDVRMPGVSGLELQRLSAERGIRMPFVIMSAHAELPSARLAFRQSAVDFLVKPFDEAELLAAIEQSFARERLRLQQEQEFQRNSSRYAGLTQREREVCDLIIDGLSNHEIADRLGMSHRTAQVHRGHIMAKMRAASLAELMAALKTTANDKP